MGKGSRFCPALLASAAFIVLITLQPMAAAGPTATSSIDSIVLNDQYRLTVTTGPWAPSIRTTEVEIIIVTPRADSPESYGDAWMLRLGEGLNQSLGTGIILRYETASDSSSTSDGDLILVQSTGIGALPQGHWQMYLIQESTGGTILGVTWTIGNEPSQDYQLTFVRSSISDPVEYFGFSQQSSDWIFVAIIGGEFLLLAVLVVLISRAK